MKSPNHKLTLSQETVKVLTQEQPGSSKNAATTMPYCPMCSAALQNKAGR